MLGALRRVLFTVSAFLALPTTQSAGTGVEGSMASRRRPLRAFLSGSVQAPTAGVLTWTLIQRIV